ncbi:MAG: hypothetical protein ABJN65_05785 [Parasphingorhabdus sp.]
MVTNMVFLINLGTIVFQLLCVVAVFRISWVRLISLIYDIQHILIFLLTGLLFWKWIWLNTGIIITLKKLNGKTVPTQISVFSLVVLILSPTVFNTATLGWFDTRSFNNAYFVAITKDGNEYRVPSNYFLSFSVTAAQQGLGRPFEGHFDTSTYGNTQNKEIMKEAENCALPVDTSLGVNNKKNRQRIGKYLKMHHQFILENVNKDGRLNYDFYPHHIWSNLFQFNSFKSLDKRTIEKYKFVVESVCLSVQDGILIEKLVHGSELIVEL